MSALHNAHPMIGFFASVFQRSEDSHAAPNLLSRMWTSVLTWQNRSVMRQHLLNMNDHMLHDLGLTRSDAAREANKAMWER